QISVKLPGEKPLGRWRSANQATAKKARIVTDKVGFRPAMAKMDGYDRPDISKVSSNKNAHNLKKISRLDGRPLIQSAENMVGDMLADSERRGGGRTWRIEHVQRVFS